MDCGGCLVVRGGFVGGCMRFVVVVASLLVVDTVFLIVCEGGVSFGSNGPGIGCGDVCDVIVVNLVSSDVVIPSDVVVSNGLVFGNVFGLGGTVDDFDGTVCGIDVYVIDLFVGIINDRFIGIGNGNDTGGFCGTDGIFVIVDISVVVSVFMVIFDNRVDIDIFIVC